MDGHLASPRVSTRVVACRAFFFVFVAIATTYIYPLQNPFATFLFFFFFLFDNRSSQNGKKKEEEKKKLRKRGGTQGLDRRLARAPWRLRCGVVVAPSEALRSESCRRAFLRWPPLCLTRSPLFTKQSTTPLSSGGGVFLFSGFSGRAHEVRRQKKKEKKTFLIFLPRARPR